MTAELTAMWQTIHEWRNDLAALIPKSQRPSDGMPKGTTNKLQAPLNISPLSALIQLDQTALDWAPPHCTTTKQARTWLATNAHTRAHDLQPDDHELFETDTRTTYNLLLHHLPAAKAQTPETRAKAQTKELYAPTIKFLADTLTQLGHPTSPATLRKWKERGHITETHQGYSLTQALEKIGS
ncbi:hypothetical protein [Timonella senegalensis]|uniref:hypothetical protein n=1 Tax=Timonella senegalensis TaxID=1465825 RepID=UPI002FDD7AE3